MEKTQRESFDKDTYLLIGFERMPPTQIEAPEQQPP